MSNIHGLSPIQLKMRALQQAAKHFPKRLEGHEIAQANFETRCGLNLTASVGLYEVVTKNNVRSMFDLDRLSDSDKETILKRAQDPATFNNLLNKCWNIHNEINGVTLSPISYKQRVAYNIEKAFK